MICRTRQGQTGAGFYPLENGIQNLNDESSKKGKHPVEYLKIRRTQKQVRADGSRYAVPMLITKSQKYGKVISEQAISRKKPILITGAHDSGKTRWVSRLHEHASEIWGAKIKAEPLLLDTLSPLAAWCDSPAVAQWWDEQQKKRPVDERQPWKNLKQYERGEALPDYCKATATGQSPAYRR